MATVLAPVEPQPDTLEEFKRTWASPRGISGLLREVNNIPIAKRYMVTGFAFFLVGGLLGLLMRIQLGSPENTFLDAETYNQIFTMHGTTMMFLFVIPFIEAVATYMLPLLLGTRDLPFPRMTALSYWTYLFGGIFLYSSFLFGLAPDGGWFAYVPLTNVEFSPGLNMDFWDIGLSVAEIAAIGAAAEMIVSVLRVRAPGMSLSRMPLFAWAMLVTAVMIIFAFTPLIVGTAMLELDRKGLTAFFKPEAGGEPLLWQHIFWIFGHPEVYIMFIPAAGIVSHVVQTMARRPIVSYVLMVLSILATGFISFGLWVHHMFTTGLSTVALGFFTAASLIIAVPNGVQVFGWIATLWVGRPVWRIPLLFVIGFLVIFTIGGLTGIMVAAVPFDWQAHDTYFVVAHFHYVLIGGVVFPLFAGLYYWLPKMTGRLLSERLGRWNFWLMFVFFNVAFFPMHLSGLLGMPRRVYTYSDGLGLETLNLISTLGAFGFALGIALFVINVLWSRKRGAPVGSDPWGADSLEWAETSPPPDAQFVRIPVVRSRYPLWDQSDLLPHEPRLARQMEDLDARPARWRGTLVVSVLDAKPLAIAHVPGPTIAPLTMALGFLAILAGALTEETLLLAVGGALTAVALVLWFRPQDSETLALRELGGRHDPERLPLTTGGPTSNGWWATLVLLAVLATALITIVASYFYLTDGPEGRLEAPPLVLPAIAMGLSVMAVATAVWANRGARRRTPGTIRLGLAATWLLSAGALALSVASFPWDSLDPGLSAHASSILAVVGYQWLVLLILLAATTMALSWALLRPGDPRGYAVANNTGLIAAFAGGSASVVFGVVYLSPLFW
ncbi:MAG: cytochrome c oxidase subunit I [Gemmatimonadales bacterium]